MTTRRTPGLAPMRIRAAVLDDAAEIARVQVDTWRAAYRGIMSDEVLAELSLDARTARWDRILSHGPGATLVAATASGEIVGFASPGPARDDDVPAATGELYALYVLPEHWGTGTGPALWWESCDWLRGEGYADFIVWVLEANLRARAFYERFDARLEPGVARDFSIGGTALPEVRYRAPLADPLP